MENNQHGEDKNFPKGTDVKAEESFGINIGLNANLLVKIESIAKDIFHPLSGFNLSNEVVSIMENSTLPDGTPWSIPLLFPVNEMDMKNIKEGEDVSLSFGNSNIALMNVAEKYSLDLEKYCMSIFNTSSLDHPGVRRMFQYGKNFIGGAINIISAEENFLKYPQVDPAQTREEFHKHKFRTITGFQTRNPPHRGHEYLHKSALKITDGLLLTPVVGQKKSGDFNDEQIIRGYEAYRNSYLPEDRTVLCPLNYVMEYAGPREALMHAIIRKNLGCTHFIIGRDHAGVGNFYGPYDAWEYVSGFENLGITPIFMNEAFYCNICSEITDERICPHPENYRIRFSGTLVRNLFSENQTPAPVIMRKEVYDAVKNSPS